MKFFYIAFDAKSKVHKGNLEASNLREATKVLIGKGWYIKKIKPRHILKRHWNFMGRGGFSLIDKILFAKHLATMLKSGISLHESLEVIADQTTSRQVKNNIISILESIRAGQTLSNALARQTKLFDPLFINIIKVGEESGTLEENLEYLASELENRMELRQKIKAASFYPVIVLASTFVLGFVLAYFVLPKITALFLTLNFDLPLSTKILLVVADIFQKYGLYIFVGIILTIILFKFLSNLKFFKPFFHWSLLKMPVIGRLVVNYNLTIINRTMGILLKSGLTIDQAIVSTSEILKNVIYQRQLKNSLEQVQRGKKFSDTLEPERRSRHLMFPLLMTKMINVGERSGKLDESFLYLAEYFEKEVDNVTKNLSTILEPVLLIFVGLIIGFVAVSVITPIYQITGKFRG